MKARSEPPPAPGKTPPTPRASDAGTAPGWGVRLGEACVLAVGVTLLAAVPTALRTAGAGGSFLGGWLVATAVLLPLVVLSLLFVRAAGRGFRGLVGVEPPRSVGLGLALWIGLSVPVLTLLAALLKATTHHKGLGGVTFGVVGAVAVGVCALVAQRLVALGQRLVARGVRPWTVSAAGGLIGALPVLALTLGRGAEGASASSIRAAILDGAIVLVATALASSVHLGEPARRLARVWGGPAAALLLMTGTARVESSPPLARAIRAGGGLAATLLGALEAWTDRDHDGVGAHFGGEDCDEGDPNRHPGALEVPGDGVDQDCDGLDPRAFDARHASEAGAAAPSATAAPSLPDVILVTLDTVRADHTSAYGYAEKTTPALEALAARGLLFDHAYAPASDPQRALMPLVSGRRYSQTPHDGGEWPKILPEVDTVAERMKRAGYATAAVVSFTWLSEEKGFAQGFDRFETAFSDAHPERSVTGAHALRRALKILEDSAAKARPLFLWVHLFDAHERYEVHPGIHFGKGRPGAYDGEIAFVDKQLGALVDAVAGGPRAERTAFVVHGSHGEGFGEHDVYGHGGELYGEMIHVPLVVVAPGLSPGRFSTDAVSTLDVAPTVLALGGADAAGVIGAPLLALAADPSKRHAPIYARARKRSVVVDWPLELMTLERKGDRTLLFDLAADPAQKQDVSAARGADVERLVALRKDFEHAAERD